MKKAGPIFLWSIVWSGLGGSQVILVSTGITRCVSPMLVVVHLLPKAIVPVCHHGYKIVLVNTLDHTFLNRMFKMQVIFMKDGKLKGL